MAANETASTHRLSSTTGVHLLKVAGHSLIKGASISVESKPFHVAGHDWVVEYYPSGNKNTGEQHTSVFINLENPGEAIVRANYSFCPGLPATGEKTTVNSSTHDFSAAHKSYRFSKFVRKADLTKWGYLNDDCLLIKDIGKILDDGLKADMTVKIGWFRRFKVHGCVLAARSPVFRAQLCVSMVESRRSSIRVRGICASVFEALLYYMYKDTLPPFMEEATEEATNMAQHLLVAADRL
ncbi:BTB/POZ and MATH domain-containing protein 2-like [Aegilops tauschii subsp. strangulata]|uniref:TD and POZ domain-containing protein 4 n=1 Tax=Aegilops tauschii TaxID=37682 RepID=M8B4P6_AEGTA